MQGDMSAPASPGGPSPDEVSSQANEAASDQSHVQSSTRKSRNVWRYAIWGALVVVVVALMATSSSFRSQANLTNILEQNSMLGIVACGMLLMMISGGFDLSVGAVGASTAVTAAYLSTHGGLALGIVGGLAVGLLIGSINGALVAKAGINAFMTTFAMSSVVTGILYMITNAAPVTGNAGFLTTLALGKVWVLPDAFLVYVGVAVCTWIGLNATKWGHYLYATGGNREASYLSGVPVVATQFVAFALGGLCAALGGMILFGQSTIGQPSAATDWPLTTIAICVIGGVSLSGGEGRVQETIAATLLLGVIANGLDLLNVSAYAQPAVTGAVILIAVAADRFGRRRGA